MEKYNLNELYTLRPELRSATIPEYELACQLLIIELCGGEARAAETRALSDMACRYLPEDIDAADFSQAALYFYSRGRLGRPDVALTPGLIQAVTGLSPALSELSRGELGPTEVEALIAAASGQGSPTLAVMSRLYAVTLLYQYINPARGLELFWEIYGSIDRRIVEEFPLPVSDLFAFAGSRLSDSEENGFARDLLEAGLRLRIAVLGGETSHSLYCRVFLAENHAIAGELGKAEEYARAAIDYPDDGAATALHKCFAAIVLAGIMYVAKSADRMLRWLEYADRKLPSLEAGDGFYDHIHYEFHTAWMHYYGLISNASQQEFHARKACDHEKKAGAVREDFILAANNLATVLHTAGQTDEVERLLNDTLGLTRAGGLEKSRAAQRLTHSIAELIGDTDADTGAAAAAPGHDPEKILVALDNQMSSLARGAGGNLANADERIRVCEAQIRGLEPKPDKLLLALYRTKSLLYYRLGDRAKSRIQMHLALSLAQQDETREAYLNTAAEHMWFEQHIFGKNELTGIVRRLIEIVRGMISDFSGQGDIFPALNSLCGRTDSVLELILSLHRQKRLIMDTDEVYEAACNLKSLYTSLLRERKTAYLQSGKGGACLQHEWLPIDELKKRLPEKSVLLDFYCFPEAPTREKQLSDMRYCVFALHHGQNGIDITSGGQFSAPELRKSLLLVTSGAADEENERLAAATAEFERIRLYSQLIKPFEPQLKRADTLFISPDLDMGSLPFCLIGQRRDSYVLDRSAVAYINSARELKPDLRVDVGSSRALVAGDAAFTVNGEPGEPPISLSVHKTCPPTSRGAELALAAASLGCEARTGPAATKSLFYRAGADIVHISAPGLLVSPDNDGGEELKTHPLRRSMLFFAGANDWIRTGAAPEPYGNGVVTSEEIYLSDTAPPSLAVLSLCFGGRQHSSVGPLEIKTALISSGAGAVLLSLWEVEAAAQAVLTSQFYKNLRAAPAAEALRRAQLYLRGLTAAELIREPWLEGNEADKYAAMAPDSRPFERIRYWGGYSVFE